MKLFIFITAVFFSCQTLKNKANTLPGNDIQNTFSDTLVKDTLIKFPARPDLGFNFEYLIYLPKGLRFSSTTYLMVEKTNTGTNDSIEYHERGARFAAARSSVGNYVARKLKIPLLVPVFPRSATNWMYYTHALDRETLLSKEFGIERLDLQLLAMINDAKMKLIGNRVNLKDKFFITGFSASGTFANRFSVLHPEKIQATASGGINAIAILPVLELDGVSLKYPLGISDVKEITGKKVNLRAFKRLPKMLYMGELDENDAVAYDDAYSKEEREIVYRLMGRQLIPHRWQFVETLYRKYGIQAEFRTYPKIGHGTDLRINTELVEFFKKYLTNR